MKKISIFFTAMLFGSVACIAQTFTTLYNSDDVISNDKKTYYAAISNGDNIDGNDEKLFALIEKLAKEIASQNTPYINFTLHFFYKEGGNEFNYFRGNSLYTSIHILDSLGVNKKGISYGTHVSSVGALIRKHPKGITGSYLEITLMNEEEHKTFIEKSNTEIERLKKKYKNSDHDKIIVINKNKVE